MAPYPDSLQTNTSSATAVNTAFHICCGTAVKWPQGAPLYEGQTPDANTMPHLFCDSPLPMQDTGG